MKEQIRVILVNYSNTLDTLECLDSLLQVKTDYDLSACVVHYKSNTGLEKIKSHQMKPEVIVESNNLGFAGMNNLAIKQGLSENVDYFVLLNNDTTVSKDFLNPLIEVLKDDAVGLVSPKIYFYPGNEFFEKDYDKSEHGKVIWYGGGVIDWKNMLMFHKYVDEVDRDQLNLIEETDYTTGCCLGLRSDLINKIGLLPETYFMYFEDVAWSLESAKLGFKNYVIPDSIIWHKNASSSGGAGSDFHKYYQTRNRIIFAKEYSPKSTKMAVIKQALRDWRVNSQSDKVLSQASIDGIFSKTGENTNIGN